MTAASIFALTLGTISCGDKAAEKKTDPAIN